MKKIFFAFWSLLTFVQLHANTSQTNFYSAEKNEILIEDLANPFYAKPHE